MSEVQSWSETPAGLIGNGGWSPEDRAVELAQRESERARDRAEFEARLASNPEWSAVRKLQEALAARGWPITWINVERSRPAELEPLFTAQEAAQARTGTWGPGPDGTMVPSNSVAEQIELHEGEKYEAARLRQAAENLHLPPGSPR